MPTASKPRKATPAKAKKAVKSKAVAKAAAKVVKKTVAKATARRSAAPTKKAASAKKVVGKTAAARKPTTSKAAPAARKVAPVAKKKAAPAAKKAAAPAKKVASAAKKATPVAKAAPAAKAPAPGRSKSGFGEKFIEVQRQALITERASYLVQATALQAEADLLTADREGGDVQFDEESGEGDTLAVERERDLVLSAQARAQMDEIDHALEKIKLGTYGLCEISGLPIPKERLEEIPWARERVEYKVGGLGRW
jgi:RNA polymerase-binding transcription factor DksA